jgi:hypothetical protein
MVVWWYSVVVMMMVLMELIVENAHLLVRRLLEVQGASVPCSARLPPTAVLHCCHSSVLCR